MIIVLNNRNDVATIVVAIFIVIVVISAITGIIVDVIVVFGGEVFVQPFGTALLETKSGRIRAR